MATPTAPAGGFQNGGWYGGRQYWDGTFSDPGQINSKSNQVGAGQLVSKEVNLQSDAVQGNKPGDIEAYLAKQRAQPGTQATGVPMAGGGTDWTASAQAGGGVGGGMPAIGANPTINLPDVYKNLYASSGISEKEAELAKMQSGYTEARGKNNDNPFLSEATRVGREAKLQQLFDERTANLRGEIATKKADVETQLNLQLKQFDINSQQAQQALSQFNTLLGLGALNGASGEDIAAITRATGISSSMIQNAIKASQKKDIKTQVITSTNDSGVVTASVINAETGEVIAKNNLGAIGNKQNTGSKSVTDSERQQYYMNNLRSDVANGQGVRDIFRLYSGYLDPNQIIQIYNANSPYGVAKETPEELQALGVKIQQPSL